MIAVFCSCEIEPTSENPLITPDSATVNQKGDTVTFTAQEGYEYSWSLNNETLGRLSSRSGRTTTYTSEFVPNSNAAVQVVTLTSTIETTGTNNTLTKTAEAFVTHTAN